MAALTASGCSILTECPASGMRASVASGRASTIGSARSIGIGASSSPCTTRTGTWMAARRPVTSSLSTQEPPWKNTARAGIVVAQRSTQWSKSALLRARVVFPKHSGATCSAKARGTMPSTFNLPYSRRYCSRSSAGNLHEVAAMTISPCSRSGWARANSRAMKPPTDMPARTHFPIPESSRNARQSATRSSSVCGAGSPVSARLL